MPSPSTADWITAWSTLATVAVAVAALVAAIWAYRTQARQLKLQQQQLAEQQAINQQQSAVLALQADELRESITDRRRTALEQRRAQAAQIFLTVHNVSKQDAGKGTPFVRVQVENTSYQPIYEVRVRFLQPAGEYAVQPKPDISYANPTPRVMPEKGAMWDVEVHPDTGVDVMAGTAEVEFRDAAEVWWRIKPDGRIEEIPEPQSPAGA